MSAWWKTVRFLPAVLAAAIAGQILRTGHRRDLPSFPNQDPSGSFGSANSSRLRVIAVGDSSITAPGVEPLDDAWVRRVALELAADWNVELISVAEGGAKARDVLSTQAPAAAALQADLVLLSVGANDALRATTRRRYRAEMTAVCAHLAPVSGAIVILGIGDLGTIPRIPAPLSWVVSRRGYRLNETARTVAGRFPNVLACDPWNTMTGFASRDLDLWADDMFHASARGHAIFYRGAMPVIRRALRLAGNRGQ